MAAVLRHHVTMGGKVAKLFFDFGLTNLNKIIFFFDFFYFCFYYYFYYYYYYTSFVPLVLSLTGGFNLAPVQVNALKAIASKLSEKWDQSYTARQSDGYEPSCRSRSYEAPSGASGVQDLPPLNTSRPATIGLNHE